MTRTLLILTLAAAAACSKKPPAPAEASSETEATSTAAEAPPASDEASQETDDDGMSLDALRAISDSVVEDLYEPTAVFVSTWATREQLDAAVEASTPGVRACWQEHGGDETSDSRFTATVSYAASGEVTAVNERSDLDYGIMDDDLKACIGDAIGAAFPGAIGPAPEGLPADAAAQNQLFIVGWSARGLGLE